VLLLSLLLNLALVGLVYVQAKERRADRREQQRERQTFMSVVKDFADRIMYTQDKPWTLPPRPAPVDDEETKIEPGWEEV